MTISSIRELGRTNALTVKRLTKRIDAQNHTMSAFKELIEELK